MCCWRVDRMSHCDGVTRGFNAQVELRSMIWSTNFASFVFWSWLHIHSERVKVLIKIFSQLSSFAWSKLCCWKYTMLWKSIQLGSPRSCAYLLRDASVQLQTRVKNHAEFYVRGHRAVLWDQPQLPHQLHRSQFVDFTAGNGCTPSKVLHAALLTFNGQERDDALRLTTILTNLLNWTRKNKAIDLIKKKRKSTKRIIPKQDKRPSLCLCTSCPVKKKGGVTTKESDECRDTVEEKDR